MPSNINPSNIDTTYPIAGQDNDTQGFHTNFITIYDNFLTAASEITTLQSTVTNAPSITTVPISLTAAGAPGQIAYDQFGDYFYICYATNTWAKFPSSAALAGASYVDATGTSDALVANYNPTITNLYDGQILGVGAQFVNTSSLPTLKVNNFSPLPIYKGANFPLLPGDIGGINHEMQLIYNVGTNSFTLLNPIFGVSNASISTGTFTNTFTDGIVTDYITGNGRISVGSADVVSIYNNGIGNIQMAQFSSNGLSVTGNISPSIALYFSSANIIAAGTSQANATPITADNNYVSSGTGGVILPVAVTGREISITNNTSFTVNVYPSIGASIENASANISVPLPAYATLGLAAKSPTNWWATQPVYNPGSGISITQSANGTVTWSLSPNLTLTGGNLLFSVTSPTISSGFGTNASINGNNGSLTFRANIGTGGVATSGIIGLPIATTGWNAQISVFNPAATNLLQTTAVNASSNVSITLTNYWTANGAITAWPANTILMISATAY